MRGCTPKFTDGLLGSSLRAVGLNSQVLKSCWPEVSSVPCQVDHSALKHDGFIRVSKRQHRWENTSAMEITVIWNLLVDMPSHHLCCILLMRSKALGPVCTQGEGTAHDHEYRKWGTLGPCQELPAAESEGPAFTHGFSSSTRANSMTLGKLCTSSKPPFSHLLKRYNNRAYLRQLLRLNK